MADRDPEIERTLGDIRKTVEEAQQAARDQLDVSNEVERLFLLYQNGGVVDKGKTSDTLLVAKASKKLDLIQFRKLAAKVKQVKNHFGDQQKAQYQKELWSLTNSNGSAWSKFDSPEFSPNRNANNEPIDDDGQLPDVSQLLPPSFTDGSASPMATPLADMMRGQEAHPQQIAGVDRLESMLGKFGLRIPDFKTASITGARERELDTHQYYNLGTDELAKSLSSGGQYAATAHQIDPTLYSGNANHLGQPMPNEDQARQWAESLRNLHESRVAKLAEKHGAQKSSPPFAQTKQHAKSYTEDARKTIQEGQLSGTTIPQESTAGAPSIEAPPIQTAENRTAGDAGNGGSQGMSMLDWLQLGLDGAGVLEPTPFADLANAGISLGRAAFDPQNAGQHLTNAGISLVSTIPYAGDLAKLAKGYGKGGKALGNTIEGFASSKAGKAAYGMFGGGSNAGLGGNGSGGGSGGSGGSTGSTGGLGGFGDPGNFNMVAATTIGLIGAFKALNAWVVKTADSGKELIESQRNLALYSGELSNAFQKSDTNKVLRDIRKADYLDSSAAGLAGAQSDYQDAISFSNAPHERFNNDWSNAMTQIGTITVYLQSLVDFKGLLLRGIYAIVDATKENTKGDPTNVIEAIVQKYEEDKKAAEDAKKNPQQPNKPRLPADGVNPAMQQALNRINLGGK